PVPTTARRLPLVLTSVVTGVFGSRPPRAEAQAPPPAPAQGSPAESKSPPPNNPSVPSAAADALSDPEIQKQLQGKTPEEAKAWGAQMSAKGLKRLPFDDLVAWNDIRTTLAASCPAG